MIFVCGAFTKGQKKPCKHCRNFFSWGVSAGMCRVHNCDTMTWEHCKYYKRDSTVWTKDGKCKIDEKLLYV